MHAEVFTNDSRDGFRLLDNISGESTNGARSVFTNNLLSDAGRSRQLGFQQVSMPWGLQMNCMRKWVGLFMALAFAAFALPATAQKVYTLNFSPPSLTAGSTGVSLSATMNNISADTGNSTAKSFKLVAPNGITIQTPASGNTVSWGSGTPATIQNNGNSIYVSNIHSPSSRSGPLYAKHDGERGLHCHGQGPGQSQGYGTVQASPARPSHSRIPRRIRRK